MADFIKGNSIIGFITTEPTKNKVKNSRNGEETR